MASKEEETLYAPETGDKNSAPDVSNIWNEENVEKTATLWELTDEEKADLILLGQKLADIAHAKNQPSLVVRFLLARPGHIEDAEALFRKSIAWRLENGVDTILKDYNPPQVINDHFSGAVLKGLDKEGDPIFLSRCGAMNIVGLVALVGGEEITKFMIWLLENMLSGEWNEDYETKQGKPVRRITIIEDLEGWALRTHLSKELVSLFGGIMRFFQDCYPEIAKKMLFVRAPTVFRIGWNLVKHFLDRDTTQKIIFSGHSNFESTIEDHLDIEVLPSCMVAQGKGEAYSGFPPVFSGGGPLPKSLSPPDEQKTETPTTP